MRTVFPIVVLVFTLCASWGLSSVVAEDKKAEVAADSKETGAKDDAKHAEPAKHDDHSKHDEHGKAGGHDPHDLSHGNATANLSAAQELRFDMSIATFLVFMALLLILGKFAWGPIMEGLDKREHAIESRIAEAHQSAHKAAEQLKQYEARLAAAAEEAKEIAMGARREAEIARDQILAEAKAGAQKERDKALEEISAAKNLALQQIAEKSVNIAVRLASSLIQREIKPTEHAQLIREAVDTFPSAN